MIKNTGFLDGLYTDDELQSENIKDRDAKIAFLQKTIDALSMFNDFSAFISKLKTISNGFICLYYSS